MHSMKFKTHTEIAEAKRDYHVFSTMERTTGLPPPLPHSTMHLLTALQRTYIFLYLSVYNNVRNIVCYKAKMHKQTCECRRPRKRRKIHKSSSGISCFVEASGIRLKCEMESRTKRKEKGEASICEHRVSCSYDLYIRKDVYVYTFGRVDRYNCMFRYESIDEPKGVSSSCTHIFHPFI